MQVHEWEGGMAGLTSTSTRSCPRLRNRETAGLSAGCLGGNWDAPDVISKYQCTVQ